MLGQIALLQKTLEHPLGVVVAKVGANTEDRAVPLQLRGAPNLVMRPGGGVSDMVAFRVEQVGVMQHHIKLVARPGDAVLHTVALWQLGAHHSRNAGRVNDQTGADL